MLLKPLNQVIEGYNDKIVVNTSGFELGKSATLLPDGATPTSSSPNHLQPIRLKLSRLKPSPVFRIHTLEDHQEEKEALILGMIGVSLFVIWYL